MENLLETLVTMESIAKLRSEINNQIEAYIDKHRLFGDYQIKSPFEVGDCDVALGFEVEWFDHLDHSEGKTVYFYLEVLDGHQINGKYIDDLSLSAMELFYNNILLTNAYEPWS